MSLYDMLEINGQAFMNAVMEMKRVQAVIDHAVTEEDRASPVGASIKPQILEETASLMASIQALYARAALISAQRLHEQISADDFTYNNLRFAMADIESRLRDELGLVKLFVLDSGSSIYLASGTELLGQQVADRFPSVLFEMEEAAKCHALSRPTASAFHCMRALEVAVRAFARYLNIDDPMKPAERNWGVVLGKIKEEIDKKYPAKSRMPNSEGSKVEALYATLDAIKNPWRNATMHTENVYQPFEAMHIIQATNLFLLRLSEICDEDGEVDIIG